MGRVLREVLFNLGLRICVVGTLGLEQHQKNKMASETLAFREIKKFFIFGIKDTWGMWYSGVRV